MYICINLSIATLLFFFILILFTSYYARFGFCMHYFLISKALVFSFRNDLHDYNSSTQILYNNLLILMTLTIFHDKIYVTVDKRDLLVDK